MELILLSTMFIFLLWVGHKAIDAAFFASELHDPLNRGWWFWWRNKFIGKVGS